jgi:hypothetical protein
LDRRSGVDLEGTFSWVFFEGKRGGGCFRQTWRGLLRIKVAGFAWSVHVARFALIVHVAGFALGKRGGVCFG